MDREAEAPALRTGGAVGRGRPSVALACDGCGKEVRGALSWGTRALVCPRCGGSHPLQSGAGGAVSGPVSRCLRCGLDRLYLQKDFNRRVGLWMFVIAALLSIPTWGLSLVVVTLIDLALYALLPDVTLCYGCGAQHRGFPKNRAHGPYDLHVAEAVARGPRAA